MRHFLRVLLETVPGPILRPILRPLRYRARHNFTATAGVNALPYLIVLVIAYALKSHYSRADSDSLRWILFPVAQMVETFGTMSFQYDSALGYVDHAREVIIAPGCAGINFMIVALCMTGFVLPSLSRRLGARLAWLGAALASAYILTIIANTIRILVAVWLYQADIYGPLVTPDRVHRLAGIGTYLFLLCGFHWVILRFKKWWLTGGQSILGPVEKCLVSRSPILWYLAVTIGMPILNGIGTHRTHFNWEHYATILGSALFVFLWIDLVHRSHIGAKSRRFDAGPAIHQKKGGV